MRQSNITLIFILLGLSNLSFAMYDDGISFGDVFVADKRMDLTIKDFSLKTNLPNWLTHRVRFKKQSIQWVRYDNVLLMPRARIAVYFKEDAKNIHLKYRKHSINLQQSQLVAHTEFFVSLFQQDEIVVYFQGKEVGSIWTVAKKPNKKRNTLLIDYSCSKYKIEVENLENEFTSLGCRTRRVGSIGSEAPIVELLWTTANYKLIDNARSPYVAVAKGTQKIKASLINHLGEKKSISITIHVPKRIHRLGTAIGFGPYYFSTTYKENESDDLQEEDPHIAPAGMLYFNFHLYPGVSVRGFNALVSQSSLFNNGGIYFANDLAVALDNKLTITTLIGVQALYFRFKSESKTFSEPIFPQGIEFTYKHPFGNKNHVLGGGAFLSPSESFDYQNVWIRYNGWELNYIYWGQDGFSAKMWGLSYILPLAKLF